MLWLQRLAKIDKGGFCMMQRVLQWLQELTQAHQEAVVATAVSVGRSVYRGQLRSIREMWWLQGLAKNHKSFCDHSVGHRLQRALLWLPR